MSVLDELLLEAHWVDSSVERWYHYAMIDTTKVDSADSVIFSRKKLLTENIYLVKAMKTLTEFEYLLTGSV